MAAAHVDRGRRAGDGGVLSQVEGALLVSVAASFVDPRAIVDTPHVGDGTRIWEFVHVLRGARIGRNCNINSHVFIENDVVIGDDVTVKCGVYLWDGVRLESRVFVGPNV